MLLTIAVQLDFLLWGVGEHESAIFKRFKKVIVNSSIYQKMGESLGIPSNSMHVND